MANINPSNKKPPEFELIELLFLGIPKTFLLNCLFQVRFQSFIDQIPYYLYSSIKKNVKLTYSKIGISINNNIKVYSSLKDVKIRYISKNRLRIACKKLLHQKNDNIFNSNMIEHYKENKQWLDAKLYVYSNDEISIISYQKQYSSSAIQEYVVNLTKEDQAIEYNQERVGVVVFILANNLEYISHVKDHVLLNEESQNILTIRKCKQDDKYKKIFMFESNGDGSIHQHRGRRDIDGSCKIAGDNNDDDMLDSRDNNVMSSNSVGNILRPVGYNIINWIRRYNISKLNLNFVKQVKNWFEDDGSRIDEKKIDTSDHLEYKDSEILKLNQDILDSKLLEIATIKQQIIELESKLVVAKRILRESNQTVVTEENQYIDRQEQYKEYEEELSSRLYKLHEKKLKTKKDYILEYQELVRSEICDEIECTEQNITRLDELNESYWHQLKKLRAELSQDQDTIRSLNDKIRDCEGEEEKLTNYLLSLKKVQEGRLDYSDELEELIQAKCSKLDMNINKLLEKDKELSIRYKKLQDQRDEIKKIKDQIKYQELIIEDYDKKINKLGQYLGTLREEVKNLSQNNELLQYQKQILENVDDDIICCNSSQILNRFIDNNKSISNIVNKDIVVSYSEYAQNLTYSTYAAFDENRIEYIGGSVSLIES